MKKSMIAALFCFTLELGAILMLVNFTLSYQDNKDILDYQKEQYSLALSTGDVAQQERYADWMVESSERVDWRLSQMVGAGMATLVFGMSGFLFFKKARQEKALPR